MHDSKAHAQNRFDLYRFFGVPPSKIFEAEIKLLAKTVSDEQTRRKLALEIMEKNGFSTKGL